MIDPTNEKIPNLYNQNKCQYNKVFPVEYLPGALPMKLT